MRADLVFAVVADVVHAHENSQKLPVLLKVQTLQEGGDSRGPRKTRARDCQEIPVSWFLSFKKATFTFLSPLFVQLCLYFPF